MTLSYIGARLYSEVIRIMTAFKKLYGRKVAELETALGVPLEDKLEAWNKEGLSLRRQALNLGVTSGHIQYWQRKADIKCLRSPGREKEIVKEVVGAPDMTGFEPENVNNYGDGDPIGGK